jgi:hypothetical protein
MALDASKREFAVFTIVQDEPEFIHPWINHYKKHVVGARDLHVLVHAPTGPDGKPTAAEALPAWHRAQSLMTSYHNVTVIPAHHSAAFDHRWLADTVARFQSFLLSSYSWVLFAEADEFVLPISGRTSDATLLDLLRALGDAPPPAIRASGFEVVHQPGEAAVPPRLYSDGAMSASWPPTSCKGAGSGIAARFIQRPSWPMSRCDGNLGSMRPTWQPIASCRALLLARHLRPSRSSICTKLISHWPWADRDGRALVSGHPSISSTGWDGRTVSRTWPSCRHIGTWMPAA